MSDLPVVNLGQRSRRNLHGYLVLFAAVCVAILLVAVQVFPTHFETALRIFIPIGLIASGVLGYVAMFTVAKDMDTTHSDPDVQALLRKEISLLDYAQRKGIGRS